MPTNPQRDDYELVITVKNLTYSELEEVGTALVDLYRELDLKRNGVVSTEIKNRRGGSNNDGSFHTNKATYGG